MKEYIAILLCSFLFLQCSQKKLKNDLYNFELQGKVKSMRRCSFICPIEFGKVDTNKQGKFIERFNIFLTEYQFDIDGFLIEEKTYFEDGTLDERQAYRYDESSGNKRKIEKNRYNIKGDLLQKTFFEHDKKSNTVREILEGVNRHYYKYNDDNDLIEQSYFNQDSIIIHYFYDVNKNIISENARFGSDLTKRYYKYENNKKTMEEAIDETGKTVEKLSYRYDTNGNNIEIFDALQDKVRQQNFFDNKNNITSYISYILDENEARFTKKEIIYY